MPKVRTRQHHGAWLNNLAKLKESWMTGISNSREQAADLCCKCSQVKLYLDLGT